MKPSRDPYFTGLLHIFRAAIRIRRRLAPPRPAERLIWPDPTRAGLDSRRREPSIRPEPPTLC